MPKIYTDGACKDGIGVWGFVVLGRKQISSRSDVKENARNCNNEMELYAVLKALEYIIQNGIHKCSICTDSAYVLTGIQKLEQWQTNDWRNSRGKPIKNRLLWEEVKNTLNSIDKANVVVTIEKTKAHAGNAFNEKVDKLVRRELRKFLEVHKTATVNK